MIYNLKQVIVVRTDLNMRRGKESAQIAHASMEFLRVQIGEGSLMPVLSLTEDQLAWLTGPHAKVSVGCGSLQELLDLRDKAVVQGITVHLVEDAGLTEFGGVPTITCAAFGPAPVALLDAITGHLKLR